MSNVRQVITSALRQNGIVGGEGARPTNWQSADALVVLRSGIRGLVSQGACGEIRDVIPRGDYVAGENERVYRTQDDPTQRIELPDMIGTCENFSFSYGRPDTNLTGFRPVRDGAYASIVDRISGGVVDFIYDGQQKRWIAIYALAVDDYDDSADAQARLATVLDMDCPFAFSDAFGMGAWLATKLAPEYGAAVPDDTRRAAGNFLIALTHAYSTRR